MAKNTSVLLEDLADVVRKEFGDDALIGEAEDIYSGGCYMYPLPLQYAIGVDIWPSHRITFGAGEPGAFKSTFLFELIRWHVKAGGVGILLDSENKLNVDYAKSVWGDELQKTNRIIIQRPTSIEEWQEGLSKYAEYFTTKFESAKQESWLPVICGVDSLLGSGGEEISNEVTEEGSASGRSFGAAVEANQIQTYLKAGKDHIKKIPINWHFVSHLKPDIEANSRKSSFMPKSYREPGGIGKDYYKALDLWFTKFGAKITDRKGYCGMDMPVESMKIILSVNKNGFGPTTRSFGVNLMWTYDMQGKQRTWFDWDAALAELIVGDKDDGLDKKFTDLKDLLKLTVKSKRYSSKVLNIDEVEAAEAGKLIHSNPELVKQIQSIVHISQRKKYGGTDIGGSSPLYWPKSEDKVNA